LLRLHFAPQCSWLRKPDLWCSISSVPLRGALWPWELSWWLSVCVLPGPSAEEGLGWAAVEESKQITGGGPGEAGEPWQHGNGCPLLRRGKPGPRRASVGPEGGLLCRWVLDPGVVGGCSYCSFLPSLKGCARQW